MPANYKPFDKEMCIRDRVPTLGNYLGAMRGWADFQREFATIYGVAAIH